MALELRVPPVGESITEVQLGEWLKPEGHAARKDEAVVLIESEKATVEVSAPADGVVGRVLKKRGETARVGEVIGYFEAGGTPAPSDKAAAPSPARSAGVAPPENPPASTTPTPAPPASPPAFVMPAARRVLAESGVAPALVSGTGPAGRITKADALAAAATAAGPTEGAGAPAAQKPSASTAADSPVAPPAPPSPAATASVPAVPGREDEVVPMSPLRRTVARRLVEAQASMAMLTTFNEVDMSGVMALRKQQQESFSARHGVKLGFMSFFVKAAIEALKQIPQLNAEIRDGNIVYHHYYDIGVAIGGGKGLVVPVLRNAERLGFADVEKAIADFGARAKEGRIKLEELAGGTFTITNGGVFGSMLSTPIINPPQSGILGMHAIQDRAVVVDGQIVVRPIMYVALTYDHRIVDGREAVTFLKRVKELIETPARILLEA
ncbi:MAG: 2-oxoglutarate dehydrogenase complex dihydrolipoyllysine-residue succinyltransferase [Verrucomicrobiales bacterium]|nr:2-oxoglutarate dehydrogenase complex dihydrolipoyllysine-residue succinyltransferase [Verrucomicrobiales bacterium]